MDVAWYAAVTGFAFAMAGTPGPNNTMVTASGASYGFRHSLPLNAGIASGVALIIAVVAGVGASVISDPIVRNTLKWVGVVYLLYLAFKIARTEPKLPNDHDGGRAIRPLSFFHGACFQLVNPKLWVMVAGAVVAFGGGEREQQPLFVALVFALIFGLATFVSTTVWTMIGVGVAHFLGSRKRLRFFNLSMAVLLLLSLIPVLLE